MFTIIYIAYIRFRIPVPFLKKTLLKKDLFVLNETDGDIVSEIEKQ